MTLYFAYGSNLNLRQMAVRCPAATPLDKVYLRGARLVFRGVADVVFEEGAVCPGGIWDITPECEEALDGYEGFRDDGGGMYRKEYVDVPGFGEVMVYVMNSTGIMPPSRYYYDVIQAGYRDFGLSRRRLKLALEHSYDDKAPSHVERQRRRRQGRPALKPRPAPKAAPLVLPAKPKAKKPKAADPYAYARTIPAEHRRPKPGKLTTWLEEQRTYGRRV